MTLILSHICPEYVINVSDRRITYGNGSHDDDAIKAVLMDCHTVFGYTGWANLCRGTRVSNATGRPCIEIPTNIWLAEVLALGGGDREIALAALEEEANIAIATKALRWGVGMQCFTGVGWQAWEEGARSQPIIFEVSNIAQDGSLLAEAKLQGITLGAGVPYSTRLSCPIAPDLIHQFVRDMDACKARGGGPASVGSVMVRLVRRAAKRHNTIGKDAIFSCIPRGHAQLGVQTKRWVVSNLPTRLDTISVHNLGIRALGFDYAPTMVIGSRVMRFALARKQTINVDATH